MQKIMKICITGACGKIAYSLYNSLCYGFIFGQNIYLELNLLDIPEKINQLNLLQLELQYCCYPNLVKINIFDNNNQNCAFQDVDLVIFLGGMSRKPGMQRDQLFQINAKIFEKHGCNLNKFAKKSCKSLVVANPPNTNCMILSKNAPSIAITNFTCLARLDHNRLLSYISRLFNCPSTSIKNSYVWGNHSRKQFCDLTNLEIEGFTKEEIKERINQIDEQEINDFMYDLGGFIMEKSNNSTYLSATKAIIDHLKNWSTGNINQISMGIIIPETIHTIQSGLCFTIPVKCLGNWRIQYSHIISNQLTSNQIKKIKQCQDQLIKQQNIVKQFIPINNKTNNNSKQQQQLL